MKPVRRIGIWAVWLGALLGAPCVAEAATCTWTGLAADNNWSSAGNWDGCGGAHPTPQAGDSLIFPAGTPRATPMNDLVDLTVAGVQITGAPAPGDRYVISGNALRLAGELRFAGPPNLGAGAGPQLDTPLVLGGASLISNLGTGPAFLQAIDTNGASLTFAPGTGRITVSGVISGAGGITKLGAEVLRLLGVNTFTGALLIAEGSVNLGVVTTSALGSTVAGTTVAAGATLVMEPYAESAEPLTLDGGTLTGNAPGVVEVTWTGPVTVTANSNINPVGEALFYLDGPLSGSASLSVRRVFLNGNSPGFTGQLTVLEGGTYVTGSLANSALTVAGTLVGDGGAVGSVTLGGFPSELELFAEGLRTNDLALSPGGTLEVVMAGPNARQNSGYGQVAVAGTVALADATLRLRVFELPSRTHVFTIVDNDGVDPVVGTFAGLPEGATVTTRGYEGFPFVISYKGGTGNDVTLTLTVASFYQLSEGATGTFFDEDVAIANPNTVEAPVTLTFLTPAGSPIVQNRTLPAQSRTTIRVDQIQGLEATDVSTTVKSNTPGLALAVERSMFWDHTWYAGHTGSATGDATNDWYFAEGSQGFFRTYLQLANPLASPTPVTVTFLRETGPPIERKYTIGATARLTVDCGSIDELANTSFAIHVSGSRIIAERAMYFGNTPSRVFTGGLESAGTVPASSWFFAEGATGVFFDTFLLFGNTYDTDATVTVQYLLDTGETVIRTKTVPAKGRLTVNIEQEDDPRLHNAAVSTLVTSDVNIVAERSMYWGSNGETHWNEGHNSFGVVEAHLHWGVAEGRIGGPLNFRTYILLANPQQEAAEVTVTFLRETGEPIVQTYRVPPTSRFNIDVATVSPDMHDESVGADIRVTNGQRIIVERSMYWDSGGVLFKGGTNSSGVPLP